MRRTKFPTKLRVVRFILYATFMTFDPFPSLSDGGKPTLIISDGDGMSPGTPRDPPRRAATDALWTYQNDLSFQTISREIP